MEKTAMYDMSHGEWGRLLRSFGEKYSVSDTGEKRLTIFNNDGKCGNVFFRKNGEDAPVRAEITDSDLEKRFDSFSCNGEKCAGMIFSEEREYAPVKIELPLSVYSLE